MLSRGSPPEPSRWSSGPNRSAMAAAERDRCRTIGASASSSRAMALNIGISSRRFYRREKLRRDIAMEHRGADMVEAALKISPDLAADIGPTLAEGEIFAEIRSGGRIDHALEQCKPVEASRQRIERVLAKELQ